MTICRGKPHSFHWAIFKSCPGSFPCTSMIRSCRRTGATGARIPAAVCVVTQWGGPFQGTRIYFVFYHFLNVYMCIHVSGYICILYVYSNHVCIYIYIFLYIHLYVSMHRCIRIWLYLHTHSISHYICINVASPIERGSTFWDASTICTAGAFIMPTYRYLYWCVCVCVSFWCFNRTKIDAKVLQIVLSTSLLGLWSDFWCSQYPELWPVVVT